MEIEATIKSPVCIRLGKNLNVLIENESGKSEYPFEPGVMFGGEHYGFILISDINGRQRETIYPTQGAIQAIGMKNNVLSIFEDGKDKDWKFDKKGRLIRAIDKESISDELRKADIIVRNSDMFTGEPILVNPIRIRVSENPEKSKILGDIEYPLYPGAMLGSLHYGFVIITGEDGCEVERAYPTQNRVEALGCEGSPFGDLKVFEEGKYHSWVFTFEGKFKRKSSYNEFSRRDKAYVDEKYGLEDESGDSFQLKKKKDE